MRLACWLTRAAFCPAGALPLALPPGPSPLSAVALAALSLSEAEDTLTASWAAAQPVAEVELSQDALLRALLRRLLCQLLGAALTLVVNRDAARALALAELGFVWLLATRLFKSFPANLGNPLALRVYPWRYGALALYLAVLLRDPALLLAWLQSRLRHMSLFQHQQYFRALGLALQGAVTQPEEGFYLQGMHLYVVGKISVTGNARSRSFFSFAGRTGPANLTLRTSRGFTLVRTRTGCLGLTLQFFF